MKTEELEKGFKEIWKLFQDTDKRMKETDKEVEKAVKAVYALTGKWSRFVEGLIAPAAERIFKERGIEVDKVFQRVKAHRNGDVMEIDVLAINGEYAIVIEAKSSLSIDDVKEHIVRLDQFKKYFPEYKDRKVVGALGGIVIEERADRYAYKQGMFVITESGETVTILNDKNFEPKVW